MHKPEMGVDAWVTNSLSKRNSTHVVGLDLITVRSSLEALVPGESELIPDVPVCPEPFSGR